MPYSFNENGTTEIISDQTSAVNNLLRSTEVNAIISHKPGFLIRWGITIFFLLVLLIVTASFFIHYPDTVEAGAKLTSINAPKEVICKTAGKLIMLDAAEGRPVHRGQLLGFIESQADHYQVISLSQVIDSLQILLANNRVEAVKQYLRHPYEHLGEVQQPYQNFMQAFILFNQYVSEGYYLKRKMMLQKDLVYLQRLNESLVRQKAMQQEDLDLATETFNANSTLKEQKVISPLDYRNEKSKYIGKALAIPQISSAIISNENSSHEKQKDILQLENEITQQKGIFTQALNTLKAQLDDWKSKYLLTAQIEGKVAFAGFIQVNQQLQANQVICFINPGNSSYYAEVYIPQSNFGKIKRGQRVLLKLPSYPFQEYGAIEGKLDFVSHIATDSGYAAKISLTEGLKTNYNKQVQYRDGLIAKVEIITENLKLSDRFINQVRGILKKE